MGDGETVILFMAEIRRSPVRVVYRYPIIYKVFFAGLIKGPAILGGVGWPAMMRRVNREVGDGDGFSIMVKRQDLGLWDPSKWANFMAYKWGWSDRYLRVLGWSSK